MRKRFLSLVVAAGMIMSTLTACGSGDKKSTGDANKNNGETQELSDEEKQAAIDNLIANTEGTVDLTLWCSETQEYQDVMSELVENFKNEYKDVDFNITVGAQSTATCGKEVLNDVEAAADLFVFPDDQINDLVKAGALQSVDATFTYDPSQTNSEATVEAATVDGKLYAYPLTASNGYFLYYNKDYLTEEDVSSWDNLIAAASKQGKTVGMEFSGAWFLYGFFAGAGLEVYMQEDGKNYCNWNATDTEYTGADVAKAITDICKNDCVVSCSNEYAQARALKGEMIADVNGTWATSGFSKAYGDGYAAAKLPTFTVNGEQVQMSSFAGYAFIGVNSYSKNTGWAMLLAEYLSNEESQTKIGVATGEAPSNLKAAESDEIVSSPAIAALLDQSRFAHLQRVNNNFFSSGGTLGKAIKDGQYDDVQKLLDEAVEGITQ